MKTLRKYSSRIEANLAKDMLIAEGIQADLLGAKEYASFYTGSEIGLFELSVNPVDFEKATLILEQIDSKEPSLNQTIEENPRIYLKKAVVYSVCALVLFVPLVFNVISMRNAALYWKNEKNQKRRVIWFGLITLFQIPSLVGIIYITNNWIQSLSLESKF